MNNPQKKQKQRPAGWDAVARWYDGWMGEGGSDHHQKLAIPNALDLLQLQPDEHLLDIGCGQGVFAPYASKAHARYTGIDISPTLVKMARQRHRAHGQFIQGDARRLARVKEMRPQMFDAALFLLSIQDMSPLHDVIESSAWVLKPTGRLVIIMTHPCFRIPRQSGWGFDEGRNLRFRRVDSYLKPLSIPMKAYESSASGKTISFHRPLETYINTLAESGFRITALREISTYKQGQTRAEQRANAEIPLFLSISADIVKSRG